MKGHTCMHSQKHVGTHAGNESKIESACMAVTF